MFSGAEVGEKPGSLDRNIPQFLYDSRREAMKDATVVV